jgi:anti-sigma factor RsiW
MSCSPSDLKEFFFGELGEAERSRVRAHLESCRACAEELDRLQLTEAALHALGEEEPPRRISFVSDKIFEPRWWNVLWNSGPRLGFVSAAILAAAIVVHAFVRPMPVLAPASVNEAAIEARISAEVSRRLAASIQTAVVESEARQAKKTSELVEAARNEVELQRRADRVAFEEAFTLLQKRYNGLLVADSELGGQR